MTLIKGIRKLCFAILLSQFCKVDSRENLQANRTATIVFTGDISFDGPVKYFAEVEKTCDYKRPFDKVKKFLADADLRVGSLNSPLLAKAYDESPPNEAAATSHYGSIAAVEGLKYAGFDIVQVANNHFADFGETGVKSTISALKKAGIAYVGFQDRVNKRTSQTPVVKTVNGLKIGFLSYCLTVECGLKNGGKENKNKTRRENSIPDNGPVPFDKRVAFNDITWLKKHVDFVVVLMHWGKEFSTSPELRLRLIAESLVVFGASIIIGSHPRVVQGHQCLGPTALTAYSLGNFLFPKSAKAFYKKFLGGKMPSIEDVQMYTYEMESLYSPTQLGMMLRVTLSKKGILKASFLPVYITNEQKTNCLQPTPAAGKWIEFCGQTDLYCINWADVCSTEPAMYGALRTTSNKKWCILEET